MTSDQVKDFFDAQAPSWDAEMIKDDAIVGKILDIAKIRPGIDVLDVACGTGVLMPDYLERSVNSVTGVDLSPEMIRIASEKYPGIRFICCDIEECEILQDFDAVMVYNAFPHFPDPERLICKLSSMLKDGGTLTVAHGMSREKIHRHHEGSAKNVSIDLLPSDELSEIMSRYLEVTDVIDNDSMYLVSGTIHF